MTSTENPDQNEYEESFKRFKTLFIVGAACFCIGVTVVILGNRFQLYEVQRLGIIFSSFGIGWIVLAISYLVYMKWCFIPGDGENAPQQVVERHATREGSLMTRTLGRPQCAPKAIEKLPRAEEKTLERHTSPAQRSYGRSTSLAPNLHRSSTSVNGFEKRPLHSSRHFERRSYSVRNFRDRSYGKDCKRLTSSIKHSKSPLPSNLGKIMPVVGSNNTQLQRNFEKLPFLREKPENAQAATKASAERYFNRISFPEEHCKLVSSALKNVERPLGELRNSEKPSAFVNRSEKQTSLVRTSGGQMLPVKNFGSPSTFSKHFEERLNSNFETKTVPMKNCEMPPNALENSFERELSLVKGLERPPTPENYGRQSVSMKHSCTCQARNYGNSFPLEKNLGRPPSVQHSSDASQSCKIDLDTKHETSFPPDYYAVVLSMHKSEK